jgi:hypothetical protein
MRFFNTEGPVRPEDHYCLPPLTRWDQGDVASLIERLSETTEKSPGGRRIRLLRL